MRRNTFFLLILVFPILLMLMLGDNFFQLPYFNVLDQVYTLLLPVLIYLILFKKDSLKETLHLKGIKAKTISYCILLTIFIIIISAFLTSIYTHFFGTAVLEEVQGTFEEIEQSLPLYLSLISLAVMPAIIEETIFRGILLSFKSNYSIHVLALFNGFLFGIFHMNTYQFSYTFAIGMILAYLTIITGSILPAMFTHFLNNGWPTLIEMFESLFNKTPAVEEVAPAVTDTLSISFGFVTIAIIAVLGTIAILKRLAYNYNYNDNKRIAKYSLNSQYKRKSYLKLAFENWALFAAIALFIISIV